MEGATDQYFWIDNSDINSIATETYYVCRYASTGIRLKTLPSLIATYSTFGLKVGFSVSNY